MPTRVTTVDPDIIDPEIDAVEHTPNLDKTISRLSRVHTQHNSSTGIELSTWDDNRGDGAATSAVAPHESVLSHVVASNIETLGPENQNANSLELEDSEPFPEGGWMAWRVVLGSFFGLIAVLGFINSIGAVQAYISIHQLENMSESQVSWIFSVLIFLCYVLSGFA